MIKQLIILTIILITVGLACAGEIVKEDHGTVFIYGAVEDTVFMSGTNSEKFDFNKTVCINATVIEGEIDITSSKDYELEYTFIADLTADDYISRSVILKQEILSTSWLTGGVKLERTLTIDGIELATYETTHNRLISMKHNTFYWSLIDNNVRFGDEVINNQSLAFTQLNYQDQQDFIPEQFVVRNPKVSHKYISVGIDEEGMQLTGITGMIYNACGWVPGLGNSLQGLMFLPLGIVQYTFNFIFTFLFLIINNWWYAVLLLEIFCIIPALTHQGYPEMVSTYITMHAKIFEFMYHKVILPSIRLILRIIEIIRNMIPFL